MDTASAITALQRHCPQRPAARDPVTNDPTRAAATPSSPADLLPALLAACASLPSPEARARTHALLRLLEAGLRLSELAALQDAGLDLPARRAWLVAPEGDGRWVRWGDAADAALRAYGRLRSGSDGGALFRGRCGQPFDVPTLRRIVVGLAVLALLRSVRRGHAPSQEHSDHV